MMIIAGVPSGAMHLAFLYHSRPLPLAVVADLHPRYTLRVYLTTAPSLDLHPTALWGPQGPLGLSNMALPQAIPQGTCEAGWDPTSWTYPGSARAPRLVNSPEVWVPMAGASSPSSCQPGEDDESSLEGRIQGRLQEPRLGRITATEGQGSQNLPSRNYRAH